MEGEKTMNGKQRVSADRSITTTNINSTRHAPAVILAILFLWTPHVLALDRMGPAVSQLGQGKLGIGLDYASSNTDLQASGHSIYTSMSTSSGTPVVTQQYGKHSATMDRVDIDRFYTTIGYGLGERTDVFFRLGGAQIDWKDDGGTDLALSGGVRSTFYATDRLQIGGLAQIGWSEAEYKAIPFPNPFNNYHVAMHGELSLYEIQAALAASYRLTERVSVYGGPFLYFADGDLDLEKDEPWHVWIPEGRALSLDSSYDLAETCRLGGYIGAQYKITPGMTWGIEYQYTADADAITTGLVWRL